MSTLKVQVTKASLKKKAKKEEKSLVAKDKKKQVKMVLPEVNITNGERGKIGSLLSSEDLKDKETGIGIILHYRQKGMTIADIFPNSSDAKRIQRGVTRARAKIKKAAVKKTQR